MIVLDFLFYYLALYFENNPRTLTWSTPVERAGYVVTLISLSWIMAIEATFVVYFIKAPVISKFSYIDVVFGIFLIWLYQYIYVTKGRYDLIKSNNRKFFDLKDNVGILISWIFLFFSFSLPFIILISNIK